MGCLWLLPKQEVTSVVKFTDMLGVISNNKKEDEKWFPTTLRELLAVMGLQVIMGTNNNLNGVTTGLNVNLSATNGFATISPAIASSKSSVTSIFPIILQSHQGIHQSMRVYERFIQS